MDTIENQETVILSFAGNNIPVGGVVKDILQLGENLVLVLDTGEMDIKIDVASITAWGKDFPVAA